MKNRDKTVRLKWSNNQEVKIRKHREGKQKTTVEEVEKKRGSERQNGNCNLGTLEAQEAVRGYWILMFLSKLCSWSHFCTTRFLSRLL